MNEPVAPISPATGAAQDHWIVRSEAALDGEPDPDIVVLRAGPPPVLDATGRRALISPLMAGFLWSAAIFVEQQRGTLDSLGLLLRLVALAVTLRSILLAGELITRLRISLQHRRYQLALADEGALLRTPAGDVAIEKCDVVDVRAQVVQPDARESRTWADIYLVTKPQSGRCFVTLPPVFGRVPSFLVDQLMEWRGTIERAPETEPASVMAFERRRGLPRRGPYATVLLGVVLLESFVRLPEATRSELASWVALVVVSCVVLVPALWVAATWLRFGARTRPMLEVSAAQLTVSTRATGRRLSWAQITRVEAHVRNTWSLLLGAHKARSLTIGAFDARGVRLDDDLLQDPIDVVCALCDAYRHKLIR